MNERITIGSHDADHQFCPDLVVEYREECDRILDEPERHDQVDFLLRRSRKGIPTIV